MIKKGVQKRYPEEQEILSESWSENEMVWDPKTVRDQIFDIFEFFGRSRNLYIFFWNRKKWTLNRNKIGNLRPEWRCQKFDFWGVEQIRFGVEKYLYTMFPYIEKYAESESDTQNNDLLYKIDQKCQNTFGIFKKQKENPKKSKNTIFYFVISINCVIHIL